MGKGGKGGGGGGGDTPLVLIGTAAADRLTGGSADDRFTGLGGDDEIKGGGGTDTAVYSGNLLGYDISYGRRGSIIVTDIDPTDGDDGTDTLYDVEFLEFADYTFSTTTVNDIPLVIAPDTVTVEENGTAYYTFTVVSLNGEDPRGYLTAASGVGATFSTGSLSADGTQRTITYEISGGYGPVVDALAVGETMEASFELVAGTLYYGYHYRQEIAVTVVGINDAPTLAGGYLAVLEDGGPGSVDLSPLGADIDSDDDGASLAYRIVGAPAGYAATIDGTTFTFDPGDGFQELERTDSAFLDFTIEAVDRHGAVSNTATLTVEVMGQNDPLPDYLNPDGSVDYAALGVTIPTAYRAAVDGFSDDPWTAAFVAGTPGDDLRVVRTSNVVNLDDNTFFGAPYSTMYLGGGNDVAVFLLEGATASVGGFTGVNIRGDQGDDVVVIDATAVTGSWYINVTDIRTGTGSDQVFIDLATEADGHVDGFRSGLDIDTGDDNDILQVRRIDSNGGAQASFEGGFSLGGGDDVFDFTHSVGNVADGRVMAWVDAGNGNDVVRIDTSGTTAAGPGAQTGFHGQIFMAEGDDVLRLNLAAAAEGDATLYLSGGPEPYGPEDFDVLYLDMGNVADFTVTALPAGSGTKDYLIEWNGQSLELWGWEEVWARDGLLLEI